jgi:hypothetical protein
MPYLYALFWGAVTTSVALFPALSLSACAHAGAFVSRKARVAREGLPYEIDGHVGIWLPEELSYLGNETLLAQSGRSREEILAVGIHRAKKARLPTS